MPTNRQSFACGISLLVASALTAIAPYAVMAEEQTGAPKPQGDPVEIYSRAGASPEQVNKIRELIKGFEDHAKVRWQLLINLQKQMRDMSLQVDPKESTVVAKQEEINKVVSEMATERIKLMLQIRAMLNTDQKQKLVQLMQPARTSGSVR